MSAKRINVGYLSGMHSTGSIKTLDYNGTASRERYPREIDADIDVCLTCKKASCSGKCKKVRDRKEKP